MTSFAAPNRNEQGKGNYVTPEEGMYEANVVDVEQVVNPFYDEGTDNPNKKYQLKWTIEEDIDLLGDAGDGNRWSNRVTYFTGTQFGWHAKNKVTGFMRKIAKDDFVYDPEANDGAGEMTSFADLDELKAFTVGRPLRIVTEHTVKKTDDGVRTYQKITGVMSSTRPRLGVAELMARTLGGEVTFEEDIPF